MPDLADIVIVGGGLLGTALAYHLTRRNYQVALLEAGELAGAATGNSFAWVNASAKEEETYHRLNAQGVACYNALAETFGAEAIGLHGGGALFWAAGDDGAERERLRQSAARLQQWGYPTALLTAAEMRALEPHVHFAAEAVGLFTPADRWIEAERLTRFLAAGAQERRADLRVHCPAIDFTRDTWGAISTVKTPQGRIATRILVLAAGVETPGLIAHITGRPADGATFPLNRVPGLLVETPPGSAPGALQRVLYPPDPHHLHLRPTAQGGLLIGADDQDARANRSDSDLSDLSDLSRAVAANLLRRAAQVLPDLPLTALAASSTVRLCVRPMPADGLPMIGPLPGVRGVYLAVTHSGVTLGPLLAQLLTEELLTGQMPLALLPYRPDRFSSWSLGAHSAGR